MRDNPISGADHSVHPSVALVTRFSKEADELAMQDRMAAQSLIEKVVDGHASRPKRSRLARILGCPPIPASESSLHIGAIGEQAVARSLDALPEGWHLFNSIPIGCEDDNIAHVVVGPGGVFAIHSKHHRGKSILVTGRTMLVNGQHESHIPLAHAESERLDQVLRARLDPLHPGQSHPVRSVVAVVAARALVIRERPREVSVLEARTLTRWLLKQPPRMDARAVAEITTILDDPVTWRATPKVDRDHLAAQFAALTALVRRAELIRAAWICGASIAVFAVCLALIGPALSR
jgi:hypothetical protein